MQTYVARGGRQIGNYGEEQLRSLYERGHLLPTDHYWREGMSEWSTLGELLPAKPVVKVAPRPAAVEDVSRPGWLIPLLSVGGALLVGLLLLSFLVSHHEQKMTSREFVSREKKIADDARTQQQTPAGSANPQQLSNEVQRLQDLSKKETPAQRNLTDETVMLIQDIAKHGQACRDAEAPMLELGFAPAKLTSVSEIDKRLDAIHAALPTLQGMLTYIGNLDTRIRSDLAAKGVTGAATDSFIKGMRQSGNTDALMIYWKQEVAISNDLRDNLDLLKAHYGQWHVDGEKVVFNDNAVLGLYQANVEKLKNDIAMQQTVQSEIVKTAAPQ